MASDITGKLGDALLNKLLSGVDVSTPSGELVELVSDQVLNDSIKAINDWIKGGFSEELNILTAITGGDLVDKLSGLITEDLGRRLAGSIVHIDGVQDQIGVFLGVIVASSFLPPGAAQFAGTIAGEFVFDQILDDILGVEFSFGFSSDRAIEFSYMAYNPATNAIEQVNFWEKKGNATIKNAVLQARDFYLETVNEVIKNIGGRIDAAAFGEAADIGFSHHDGGSFAANINNQTYNNGSISYLAKLAIDSDLKRMDFTDGDLILVRAFDQWRFSDFEGPDADLVKLADFMSIANDYRKYVDNVISINKIIASNPYSAFAAGWSATLLKAKQLGLDDTYIYLGTEASERVTTGSAGDRVSGAGGDDRILTLGGADIIDGGRGSDTMIGGLGNDTYFVDDALDVVVEAAGEGTADRVVTSVSFTIKAGVEVERIVTTSSSGTAAINIAGNKNGQFITGNAGANKIDGRLGADKLEGGLGNDSFIFSTALGSGNVDKVLDFANASGNNDTIRLTKSIFAALTGAAGTYLTGDQFAANDAGAATNTLQHIIYETDTGKLLYDADGNKAGGVAAVQFAQLGTVASHPGGITAGDFYLV